VFNDTYVITLIVRVFKALIALVTYFNLNI
jgi:hypothetical protein